MKIINTTPHAIRFQNSKGEVYELHPCGTVISAQVIEEDAGVHPSGARLVRTRFVPTSEAEAQLARLERENPDAVIVGSIIAAQAFPGRVFALVPVEGFERVPTADKRMRDDKFTTY